MLRTTTVEEQTLVLLKRLQKLQEFSALRLVGGTALALQIGHRKSIDLDFFGTIDHAGIDIAALLIEAGFSDVSLDNESKRIHAFKIEGIKVDVVNYPFHWLAEAIETEGVKMASMKDIAAMKLEAITNRGTKKDFVDVYFLLETYSLTQMLDFYVQKFIHGTIYNVIRSLTYFEDAAPQVMPEMIVPIKWETIKSRIQEEVRRI